MIGAVQAPDLAGRQSLILQSKPGVHFAHATALWVNLTQGAPALAVTRLLSRFDTLRINDHSHLTAKQIEQHGDALAVLHPLIEAEAARERTV